MKLDDLHSGDLLYWRGSGFKAWLVRKWTHSEFAHVGMFWRNGASPMIIEADSRLGVVIRAWGSDLPNAAQKAGMAWTPAMTNELKRDQGKPYSYLTDILTIFTIAGRGSKAYMCSELVVRLQTVGGWDWHGYQPTPEGVRLGVLKSTGNNTEPMEL